MISKNISCSLIISILFLATSAKCQGQVFDSVKIYSLSMAASYRIKIDKDLIKNEVDPIVLTDKKKNSELYRLLTDTIKGNFIRKLKSNYLDIRLMIDFFYLGKSIHTVAVTPQSTMFIDHTLYTYDKQKLKYLDRYIGNR